MKSSEHSFRRILSRAAVFSLVAFLLMAIPSTATDWPHWRGPNYDGSTDATGLPISWTPEDAFWSTDMPDPGFSTPVIIGNRLFLTSADDETTDLYALCLSSETGEILWQRHVTNGRSWVGNNNMAAPSVATDGHMSWHLFGNAVIAAFNSAGEEVWKRDLSEDYGPPALFFVYSASPLYYQGRLYVAMLRDIAMERKSEEPKFRRRNGLIPSCFVWTPPPARPSGKKCAPRKRPATRRAKATPRPFPANTKIARKSFWSAGIT